VKNTENLSHFLCWEIRDFLGYFTPFSYDFCQCCQLVLQLGRHWQLVYQCVYPHYNLWQTFFDFELVANSKSSLTSVTQVLPQNWFSVSFYFYFSVSGGSYLAVFGFEIFRSKSYFCFRFYAFLFCGFRFSNPSIGPS